MKPVNKIIHEQKQQTVYDENEKPKREHDEWRHEQEKDGPEESIEDAEEQRRTNQGADAVVANSIDDRRGDHHRDRRDRPAEKKMPHC